MFKHIKIQKIVFFITVYISVFSIHAPICAAEQSRPAPLHIKINTTAVGQSKSGVNIINAAPRYSPTPENTALPDITPAPEKRTTTKIAPQIIRTQPCFERSVKNSNRHKNIADSLKLYLNAQNRNSDLIDDLYHASDTTKVDFELLVINAMMESDLGRTTVSTTSSARGVFQYIAPTWLVLMKRHGERIGYKSYADSISINSQSRLPGVSSDSQLLKDDILALRDNTRVSALIKAYQIKDETDILTKIKGGRRVNTTDHYIAHMLGIPLAREFYALTKNESRIILADSKNKMLQEAVRLNSSFFYGNDEQALTATQTYRQFHRKIAQKYQTLQDITAQYGTSIATGCARPNIVSTAQPNGGTNALKKKTAATAQTIAAVSKTYKVNVTRH